MSPTRSILLLAVLFTLQASAQLAPLPSASVMDSLIRVMQRGADDSTRLTINRSFQNIVFQFLKNDSALDQCPVFAPNIACLKSPDGTWRILTWTVPAFDGNQYYYFGFLQKRAIKGNNNLIYTLNDSTTSIKKPESDKLSPEKWLGATYYDVVLRKKKRKVLYTLCGWKGKDQRMTQKVLEVLSFDGEKPKFGYAIFKKGKVYRSRVIFSYTAQASMSLRYEESKRMIVFDHLSGPINNTGVTDPSSQGPDGSYDAYRYRSGSWQWVGDIKIKLQPSKR